MDLDIFTKQILKTGFPLEHRIANALKKAGWTVISNKYYVDDNEETVREVDLLAYKARRVQKILVYTTLIISCKKSESNIWALLSRDVDKKDPNRNWRPLHIWSNDKALSFELSRPTFSADYHSAADAEGTIGALMEPKVDVFAFQEMTRGSGAPQNDRAIFSSISSLMKAQAYELSVLPARKSESCAYHFSLISIVDTDLVRMNFDAENVVAEMVDEEAYIADYIIRKSEQSFKIRLVNAAAFSEVLKDSDRLHGFNCRYVAACVEKFFKDIFSEHARSQVLVPEFLDRVSRVLRWQVYERFNRFPDVDSCSFSFRKDRTLEVGLGLEDEHVEFLQSDDKSKKEIAKALKSIYRYDGPFIVSQDIPF